MASLRRKTIHGQPYYYVQYVTTENGQKRRHSVYAGKEESSAKVRLAEIELELAKGTMPIPRPSQPATDAPHTVAELLAQYFEHMQFTLAQTTMARYRQSLGGFQRFLGGDTPLGKVTTAALENYKCWSLRKGECARTVRDHLFKVSSVFQFAKRMGYADSNPVREMALPKPPRNPIPDYLTTEETGELLRLAEQMAVPGYALRASAIIKTLLLTGMRSCELRRLKWQDVDTQRKLIKIHESKGKSRVIPLHPDLLAVLTDLPRLGENIFTTTEGKPLTYNALKLVIDRLKTRFSQPKRLHLHLLRHTAASWMVQRGVPIFTVSRILGHSSVSTTQTYYAQLNEAALAEGIQTLSL